MSRQKAKGKRQKGQAFFSIAYCLLPIACRHRRGFTLIELVAVMAIIIIVTSVTLANNSRFGGAVLLQNLAYDMALSIRQAQVYGIAVRGYSANQFSAGYGMHFSTSESGGNLQYELFADKDGDGLFTSSTDPVIDENVSPSPYHIGRGYYISGLSALDPDASSETSVGTIDIIFKRPEPTACISANGITAIDSKGLCTLSSLKERARITVTSPRGDNMSIVVEATGQISVQ
ncbi:MAG: type II secretion system GspH family protein [Candidatus Kaiserbacteria bacterium]|nr:type II secretion system GspH family protein [Candidatus Kaiserbacteria bacterium]